jgi:hypothetical protein
MTIAIDFGSTSFRRSMVEHDEARLAAPPAPLVVETISDCGSGVNTS